MKIQKGERAGRTSHIPPSTIVVSLAVSVARSSPVSECAHKNGMLVPYFPFEPLTLSLLSAQHNGSGWKWRGLSARPGTRVTHCEDGTSVLWGLLTATASHLSLSGPNIKEDMTHTSIWWHQPKEASIFSSIHPSLPSLYPTALWGS